MAVLRPGNKRLYTLTVRVGLHYQHTTIVPYTLATSPENERSKKGVCGLTLNSLGGG